MLQKKQRSSLLVKYLVKSRRKSCFPILKVESRFSTPVTPPKGGSLSLLRNRIMWRGALNLTRSMVESGGLDCCACNCGKVSSKIFNMCQISTSTTSALNYGFMAWDAGKVTHWGLKKAFEAHPPQKIANQVRNGVRKTVQQAAWAIPYGESKGS